VASRQAGACVGGKGQMRLVSVPGAAV